MKDCTIGFPGIGVGPSTTGPDTPVHARHFTRETKPAPVVPVPADIAAIAQGLRTRGSTSAAFDRDVAPWRQ